MTDAMPFPPEELEARRAAVGRRLAEEGLDACVVLAPETQLWLCGLDSFISGVLPQALVLTPAEHAVLVVWDADLPLAQATSVLADIRPYRFGVDDPASAFAAVVREVAPDGERIGFDGASRAVPHTFGAALGEALAPERLVDCSSLLADARTVKSPAELESLRWAAPSLRPLSAPGPRTSRTSTQAIVPGTAFVLHACLLDEEASLGVLVGGTYAVTADGIEPIAGAGAVELLRV